MLLATQTTSDAVQLVVSRGVTSRQSFVATAAVFKV